MWIVEYHPKAADERAKLPSDMRAKLFRMVEAVREEGPFRLPRDWVKPLGDKLWEFRITGKDGIARAIYVSTSGQRLYVVRIFIKKTQRTPPQEISLARQRAKEIK
jgi:phage-related protein